MGNRRWTEEEERIIIGQLLKVCKAIDRTPIAVVHHAEYIIQSARKRQKERGSK